LHPLQLPPEQVPQEDCELVIEQLLLIALNTESVLWERSAEQRSHLMGASESFMLRKASNW
jgi:hypothetical protein